MANVFDLGGSVGRGMQLGQNMQAIRQQNSLADLYRTEGAGIASGDPNALAKLAQIDPMAAFDMRRQSAADARAQQQFDMGMQVDRAQLDELKARGKRAAEEHAAKMTEYQRAQEAQGIRQSLSQAAVAYRQGPDVFGQFVQQNAQAIQGAGIDPSQVTYETFPVIAAGLTGAAEAFEMAETLVPGAPKPQSPQGKFIADQNAGLIPEGATYDSGAPRVTLNMPGQDQSGTSDFYKKVDTASADTFGALSQAGTEIPTKMAMIDQLEGLLTQANTPQGVEAALKSFAGNYGIQTEGLDNLQAAQAIISQLVPQQRPPGSGTMSDADLALFKQSLPRLINTKEGNMIILRTIRGIAQYQAGQAQIANSVMNREITPAEGRKALQELENPLLAYRRAGETSIGGQVSPEAQSLIDKWAD